MSRGVMGKKCSKLVQNDAGGRIQNLTCNLLPAKCRFDTMEGREYIVVPMVILTEGVHAGSGGPLLYPSDELSKTPVAWNHKPVVVYHPEMNGVGISACNPTIITTRKVGVMMNTVFEKGKLRSEAWIEKSRADLVDPRIMQAVEKNEMMELSTGVFIDEDPKEGEWKGEVYTAIARNYRPDHLALLPDKIGACSIADGAGFLRNEVKKNPQIQAALQKLLAMVGLTENEMSFSNVRETLTTALRKRFNTSGPDGPFLFVEDVYSNFVIYELTGKLFRLGYSASDAGVALSDETPIEVMRVTEYRTVQGAFVGNQDQSQKGSMDKKKLVDAIIANSKEAWKEEDREKLMALSEGQLTVIPNLLTASAKHGEEVDAAKEEDLKKGKKPSENQSSEPATQNEPKVVTLQDYVSQAPKELQEVLTNSLALHNEERARLVDVITTNKNNIFAKEDLEKKSLMELKAIARLAAGDLVTPRIPVFSPQGPTPTGNQVEEPLEVPV